MAGSVAGMHALEHSLDAQAFQRAVDLLLAQGLALPDILARLGHVAEGVYSAPTVLARAQSKGVEMPITAAVVEVLEGRLSVLDAVDFLMGRQARSEH